MIVKNLPDWYLLCFVHYRCLDAHSHTIAGHTLFSYVLFVGLAGEQVLH